MNKWFAKEALNWMGVLFVVAIVALAVTGTFTRSGPAPVAEVWTDGTSTPLIVVDAGHGGADGGAVGGNTGVQEAGLNLAVAKMVEAGLRQGGFTVVMTRSDDKAIGDTKRADMLKRREIMRQEGVVAIVSVHMNKFADRSIHGPMAFYMKGSDQGEALAGNVIKAVCKSIGHPERPANPGDYFIIRESIAPAVIIECGFLSNPSDEAKLQEEAHQQALADGIVAGISMFVNGATESPH